jgi:hypothetical protein
MASRDSILSRTALALQKLERLTGMRFRNNRIIGEGGEMMDKLEQIAAHLEAKDPPGAPVHTPDRSDESDEAAAPADLFDGGDDDARQPEPEEAAV